MAKKYSLKYRFKVVYIAKSKATQFRFNSPAPLIVFLRMKGFSTAENPKPIYTLKHKGYTLQRRFHGSNIMAIVDDRQIDNSFLAEILTTFNPVASHSAPIDWASISV